MMGNNLASELGNIKKGREVGHANERRKYILHACLKCGKQRWVQYDVGKAKPANLLCGSCGAKWRLGGGGGRKKRADGYILVMLSRGDFFYPMATKEHYVLEHRLVMAKYLNRCLLPWEVVHHKNGIRGDNRIENLQILPGLRFHLIDSLAKNLITRLQKDVKALQQRVTLLEAENALLKVRPEEKTLELDDGKRICMLCLAGEVER